MTYRGFRYAEVTGLPALVGPSDFEAVVISSAADRTGALTTSCDTVNRLQRNIEWTLRSNCISILTDNPDRERAGWTGDLGIIAPTATHTFELQSFLTRYLRNAAVEQYDDGMIPLTVPFWRSYRGRAALVRQSAIAS